MPAPKGHKPYKGCEKGGRPVSYTKEQIEKEADLFEQWMKKPDSLYVKEFMFERGYHEDLFSYFAQRNDKFKLVYLKSKIWQEQKLVCGGLKGDYNSFFTKFVMCNVCGWSDKAQTQVTGDSSNPISVLLSMVDSSTKDLINEDEEHDGECEYQFQRVSCQNESRGVGQVLH